MQRERYIDMAKGLAILCIVLLHYENGLFPTEVNTFVGSFMISMFYVTSGWLMASRKNISTTKELLQKRWKQLGIPYCYWTVIILVFDFILLLAGYYDLNLIAREAYKSVTLRGIGTLWFLPALFWGELVWHWLYKKKIWIQPAVFLAIIAYMNIYHHIFDAQQETIYRIINAPFRTMLNISGACIGIAGGYYFFHLIGKKFSNLSRKQLLSIGICLCTSAFVLVNYLPEPLSFFNMILASLIGPWGILCLSKATQDCRIMNYFDFWGRNSLLLMVTHYSIIEVLFQWGAEGVFHETFSHWVSLACFCLSMPIQHLLVPLFDKHFKSLLGK